MAESEDGMRPAMRAAVTGVSAVCFAVSLIVNVAPVAHADNNSFVAAAQALGFQRSADALIRSGRSMCYFLSFNWPLEPLVDRTMRFGAVSFDVAQQFLKLSVTEYCPQYGNVVGA